MKRVHDDGRKRTSTSKGGRPHHIDEGKEYGWQRDHVACCVPVHS